MTKNSGNELQARVDTAHDKSSEEEGEGDDTDACEGPGMALVPSHVYLTDHHSHLTSKLRGSSLKCRYHQYPHFKGRETEAQRAQVMGLKLHSWRETEAGLQSKGLVLLHHVISEGTTGERAALPIPGGSYSWGTGRQAPPPTSVLHPRDSPLTGRKGCGGQRELQHSQGRW